MSIFGYTYYVSLPPLVFISLSQVKLFHCSTVIVSCHSYDNDVSPPQWPFKISFTGAEMMVQSVREHKQTVMLYVTPCILTLFSEMEKKKKTNDQKTIREREKRNE